MHYRRYDIVVVGAGPAGLSAARTVARLGFRTLVMERLSEAGLSTPPDCAVIAPIPGFVAGVRRADNSLYFPALDLLIPADLIVGMPGLQRFIGPGGTEFQTAFVPGDNFPARVVDKPGLLRQMASQAAGAGAELCFRQEVTGLLRERGRISGVVTATGEHIYAQAVLSAEGAAGSLVQSAGLYDRSATLQNRVLIACEELEAPAAGEEAVGQIVTLGRRYTSAGPSFGTVLIPKAGHASVYFTVFSGGRLEFEAADPWRFLDEYEGDPRIRELLAGARVLRRASSVMALREPAIQVVRDGFMGLGDAVTPGGQLGILPAIYMGRQAAFICAEAIDQGDTSAECLAAYQQLWPGPIHDASGAESQIMLNLTALPDDRIDRFCGMLKQLSLGSPFYGNCWTSSGDTLRWLVGLYPLMMGEWAAWQQIPGAPSAAEQDDGAYSIPLVPVGSVAIEPAASISMLPRAAYRVAHIARKG